jgi:hypothetical protein
MQYADEHMLLRGSVIAAKSLGHSGSHQQWQKVYCYAS